MMYDVAVIGCGIVGAATAMELSRYELSVAVLEAGNDVACGTTKANSAILHAGYDPEPDTLMARLNVQGVALAKELCASLDVLREEVGSLVVAFSEAELATLPALLERGVLNGVEGLRLLSQAELRQIEPEISPQALGALYAPTAAIVDPWDYCLALAETAVKNGAELFLSAPATAIEKAPDGFIISTPKGDIAARYIVNAAGLAAEKVHAMVGGHSFVTHPCRGEYYLLDKSQHDHARHVIFPCPNEAGKGVLVSPTVHGNLIVGPNAEYIPDPADVANTAAGLDFVRSMAERTMPTIGWRDNIRTFAGVRAHTDSEDFIIGQSEAASGFYNLAGIKSPGLSAAPAIAKYCVSLISEGGLQLREKPDFILERRRTRFKALSAEQKRELIARDPRFGRVICRCETITEGEILEALARPIRPCSIDGIKRRCGAGMGRCQGGFCAPRVHELLARELGLSPLDITMDEEGSFILTGETKEAAR